MRVSQSIAGFMLLSALMSSAFAQSIGPYPYEGWHQALPLKMRYQVYHNQVIAFENLSEPCGYTAGQMGEAEAITGKVVGREFGPDELTMIGFVIELSDGERQFINVDAMASLNQFSVGLADQNWVIPGLDKMLNVNNVIHGTVQICAGTGADAFLNSLSSAGPAAQQ